jgi:alpha/beta superfamily hydrolase
MTLSIGKHNLRANIETPETFTKIVIFLAGGSNKPFEETMHPHYQKILSDNSITSIAFDYRGVSGDTQLSNTSLLTRLEDATAIYDYITSLYEGKEIIVSGRSMGGYIAIHLATIRHVDTLILISPAAYTPSVEPITFGEEFKKIITAPDSYKESTSFEILKNLSCKKVLIYGDNDTVIPSYVTRRYTQSLSPTDTVHSIEDADHTFNGYDENLLSLFLSELH